VFIDGRTPVYGDEFFRKFVEGFMNKNAFEEMVKRYDIDYIVLPGFRGWDMRKFHAFLWKHPHWRLVYATNDGFIYLRDTPKFRDLIKKLALKENPVVKAVEAAEKKAGEAKPAKQPENAAGCSLLR